MTVAHANPEAALEEDAENDPIEQRILGYNPDLSEDDE